jgi:sulfoxide reductase heme-binding subunit YedZ
VLRRAIWLNLLKLAVCFVALIPALNLILALQQLNPHFIRAYDYRVFSLSIAETGKWSFVFLFIALGATPLQRLTGLRWPGELRRALGLLAFFYVLLHFVAYFVIGQKFNLLYTWEDANFQHSRLPGWAAMVLLIPLALTSTDGMIRRVGAKRWKLVHRLVYVAVALAIWHLYWTEVDRRSDFEYTKQIAEPFAALMLLRLLPLSWLRQQLRRLRPARRPPAPE